MALVDSTQAMQTKNVSVDREFHSLSSEHYVPSNMPADIARELMAGTNYNENIVIHDAADHHIDNSRAWINLDIEKDEQHPVLNKDIGHNLGDDKRLAKTIMDSKSPGAQFRDIINSGASIVMSRVQKGPSSPVIGLEANRHSKDYEAQV